MKHSHKLVINSIASFFRIIINGVLTLVATRIALQALGVDDFGIFNLIAGVITLLSFINGALMVSAQRFYSIAIGGRNNILLNEYFSASAGLHVIIGLIITLFFFVIKFWLFPDLLNISADKIGVATIVYDLMVFSSLITIIGVPYSAIINAYEDMSILAFSSVVSNLIKLGAAIILLFIESNYLIVYASIMLASVIVKFLIEQFWSILHYEASKITLKNLFKVKHYKEMAGFIGWNTLGTAGVMIRNQGLAVVLNVYFGTVINAVYGIANQVNSLILSLASTTTTIFTPTIIQAKGGGDLDRMLNMSILSSKLSFLLASLMSIPIIGYTKEILDIWLHDYPDKTIVFCQYIVVSYLISQLYPGINRAVLAVGNIKWYQILTFIYYLAIIPISIVFFKLNCDVEVVLYLMVLTQVLLLSLTIRFAKNNCNLSVNDFVLKSVILPLILFIIVQIALVRLQLLFDSFIFQVTIFFICMSVYTYIYIYCVFTKEEKKKFKYLFKSAV